MKDNHSPAHKQLLITCLLLFLAQSCFAQIIVKPNRPTTRYEVGDTVYFQVSGATDASLISYQIKYTLNNQNLPILANGTVRATNGEARIAYTTKLPSFVTCLAVQNRDSASSGVSFSHEKLTTLEPEPIDYDTFWATLKKDIKAVPLDVNISFKRKSTFANIYNFDIAVLDSRRVYGYMIVPITTEKKIPAIIQMPSFGAVANLVSDDPAVAERAGVITINLSVHNNPPNVDANLPDYLTDGIASPQTYYMRHVILGAIKAIDYLQTRPDFNGQVGALGISQGGGLAALIAGLDNRITLLASAYPAFSHQAAGKYEQPSAFPYTYNTAPTATQTKDMVLSTIKYYDPVYALKRFKGVSWCAGSMKDDVCPAQSVVTGFNQLTGQHVVQYIFNRKHVEGPDEFFNGDLKNNIYAFLRRHFEPCRRAPWPYSLPTLGYLIQAGQATKTTTWDKFYLKGFVGLNDTAVFQFPVHWTKMEGVGEVTFSNPDSHQTTVTFSKAGTYRLRFTAEDMTQVGEQKYFLFHDDITINVTEPASSTNDLTTSKAMLYPNPAHDVLTLQMDSNIPIRLSVYDILGRKRLVSLEKTMNIAFLEQGTYFVEVQSDKTVSLVKFVKN